MGGGLVLVAVVLVAMAAAAAASAVVGAASAGTRVVVDFTAPASDFSALEAGYIWEYGAYKDGVTPSSVWFEVNGQAQVMELPTGSEVMHRLTGPALPEGAHVRLALASQNPNARIVCVVMTGTRNAR